MTYEEKRAWLQRYEAARQLFDFRQQQLETAKTDAGRTTQNISPVPVMDRPCREQSSASKKQSSGQLRRLVSVMKSAKRLRRRWMHWTICMTGTSCTANTSTSRVGTPSSATLTFPKVQCWRTTGRQSRAYK